MNRKSSGFKVEDVGVIPNEPLEKVSQLPAIMNFNNNNHGPIGL